MRIGKDGIEKVELEVEAGQRVAIGVFDRDDFAGNGMARRTATGGTGCAPVVGGHE